MDAASAAQAPNFCVSNVIMLCPQVSFVPLKVSASGISIRECSPLGELCQACYTVNACAVKIFAVKAGPGGGPSVLGSAGLLLRVRVRRTGGPCWGGMLGLFPEVASISLFS